MNNSSREISMKICSITTKLENDILKNEISDLDILIKEVTNCYILIKEYNEKFNQQHLLKNLLDASVAEYQSYFVVCLFDIFSYGMNKNKGIIELLCI